MSPVKGKFLKHIWNLPSIDGYLHGSLFFSKYPKEDIIRYGAFYGDQNTLHFLLLVEITPKIPDFSKLKSEKVDGKTIHFGYIPDFPVVKNWLKNEIVKDGLTTASWVEENKVFTVVSINNHKEIKDYVKSVLGSKSTASKVNLLPLFRNYKYLPDSAKDWEFITMFFSFTTVLDETNNRHAIRHVQGNYRKGNDFLNIELRFGCQHPVSVSGLKLINLANTKEIKIGDKKIEQGNIGEELFMHYTNELKRYSIICHDNKQNTKKHEKSMKLLMKKAIDNMKSFYFESIPQELFSMT